MPIAKSNCNIALTATAASRPRRSFWRSIFLFLTSNVGQIVVVVVYVIGGAFLFILLEEHVESENCLQGSLNENVSVSNLTETMYTYVATHSGNSTEKYDVIRRSLENFTGTIYELQKRYRYKGQDCSNTTGWTFASSLLFTISIITAIGYGNVTPISWEAQITCICYALIGIPIFLLSLSNLSSILGDMFRFAYSSMLHCICCCCRFYIRNRNNKFHSKNSYRTNHSNYVGTVSIDPSWPDAINNEHLDDESGSINAQIDDVWDRMETRVPVLIVILIIIGYICLGAIMFKHFEGWTMTEAVYFCYVTLATIGFGDYLPGITSHSTESYRFTITSAYIIIGLAILAMSFDLMKESMVDKMEWIAFKFGFTSDEDEKLNDKNKNYTDFKYTKSIEYGLKDENTTVLSYNEPNESRNTIQQH